MMIRGSRLRPAVGAALLAAVAGLALSAPAAIARARSTPAKLPDLVPTHAGVRGNGYALQGQSVVTTIDRTKNQGSRQARRTHTDFYLVHGDQRWLITDRFVPALGPGESHFERTTSEHPIDAPLGAYQVEVCVDAKNQVRESNENNNCAILPRPSHFYVIAKAWSGSLSGIKTLSGQWIETWQSTNASFDLDLHQGDGIFSYVFSGSVKWTDSGANPGGCSQSGSGTRTYSSDDSLGELTVDYRDGSYGSTDFTDWTPPFYTIDVACPFGGHSTNQGPSRPATFWNPSPDGTPVPMPFGSSVLPGSPAQMANVTWTWNLQAGSPK